jgi:hypothetical protein
LKKGGKRKEMKPKSKEFQVTITPGAVLACPHCGSKDTLSVHDGDTIEMHAAMPDAKSVAGGLALSKDGHCFYAHLNACVCGACRTACYTVGLEMVDSDEVSREWADAYFWLNGETAEPYFSFTAVCHGAGLPRHWTLELTKTESGELASYCFGPFIPRKIFYGSNGVAHCAGSTVWKEARALISRVWPLLIQDSAWPESVTVRGRLPLREVPGWTPRTGRKKDARKAA